jgi:predicted acyl esterase
MLWLFTDEKMVFDTSLDHLLTVSLYPYSTLCLFSFSPNFEKYFVNPLNDMLMRNSLICLLFFLSFLGKAQSTYQYSIAQDSAYIRNNYVKSEFMVKMRDGVQLLHRCMRPKTNQSNTQLSCKERRILATLTVPTNSKSVGPNPFMIRENYIVVYQDVRGRWASEGKFVEMTPHLDKKSSEKDIDESSDTYDTIDWLIKNIPNNNGKVGQWGISYPGFLLRLVRFHNILP